MNFSYLIIDHETSMTAVIDPGNPQQVYDVMHTFDLELSKILITHGHHDHALGVAPLVQKFTEAEVYGSQLDNIPLQTEVVAEGDSIQLGSTTFHVYEVPYHTVGHVLFSINDCEAAFTGDALFGGTIGNPFEARHDLVPTLEKMREILHPECLLFVGHDVLAPSIRFCAWLQPENEAVISRMHRADWKRAHLQTTMPYPMKVELETNPYFRLHDHEFVDALMRTLGLSGPRPGPEEVIDLVRKAMGLYVSRNKKMRQRRYPQMWRAAKRMVFDGWCIQIDVASQNQI